MEHYCKRCNTTREFRLQQEGNTENIYTCSYCGVEWKQKTALGHVKDFGGVAVMIVAALLGGGHPGDTGGSLS